MSNVESEQTSGSDNQEQVPDEHELSPEAFVRVLAQTGRTDVFAERFKWKEKTGYRPVHRNIQDSDVAAHLISQTPIGIYLVDGERVQSAAIDVDDHDGTMEWDRKAELVRPLLAELQRHGLRPIPFISGGGAGIHLWMVWQEPQSASDVRDLLRTVIGAVGLSEGAAGLDAGVVEIFPKQSKVKDGKLGNLIALPLSRSSKPLDDSLTPVDANEFRLPPLKELMSDPVPKAPDAEVIPERGERNDVRSMSWVGEGDESEVEAALRHISADDRGTWIKLGMILKGCFGEPGFELWNRWSQTSQKYPEEGETRRIWDGLEPDGRLTIGTLYFLAQQGGWNGPSDSKVRTMNEQYGIITYKRSTLIVIKKPDPTDTDVFQYLAKATFEDHLAAEYVVSGSEDEARRVPLAKYWMKHKKAARYDRIVFDPSLPPGHNGHLWNIWRGFQIQPVPGDWDLLKEHIQENICDGDSELYEWLLNWMALGVQKPGEVIGTAPVLKGLPGTGKGVFVNAYGELWKPHFQHVTNPKHYSGNFNSHLFGHRLVFIDEGTFGGNKREAGILKTLVTEKHFLMEAKGVDAIKVDNYTLLIVASNENFVVPADAGDRRWQVIETANHKRNDLNFFGKLMKQLRAGGYSAMLHDLLARDIALGPEPRITIKTEALFQQIIQGAQPELRYLYNVLDRGHLPQPHAHGNGPGVTTIKAMWAEMRKEEPGAFRVSDVALGKFLNKVIRDIKTYPAGTFDPSLDAFRDGVAQRSTRYTFPPLIRCRSAFERYIGMPVEWDEQVEEWQWEESPFKDL